MSDSKSLLLSRDLQVSVDRAALRDAISRLRNPGANQEWCVACGAGKGIELTDKLDWVQKQAAPILEARALKEFVEGLKDLGTQAWCVACGAGKDASPLDSVINPANISDELIDAVAARLLSAVKVG